MPCGIGGAQLNARISFIHWCSAEVQHRDETDSSSECAESLNAACADSDSERRVLRRARIFHMVASDDDERDANSGDDPDATQRKAPPLLLGFALNRKEVAVATNGGCPCDGACQNGRRPDPGD